MAGVPRDTNVPDDACFPQCLGVLRVSIESATGLPAADCDIFGRPTTSDPYVKLELGQVVWHSPVKYKTLEPVWTEANIVDLPVFDMKQTLRLTVWDKDVLSADDFL